MKYLIAAALAALLILWLMKKKLDSAVPADRIQRFAEAIAAAEGFFVPGSRPARNHNPGNLTLDIGGNSAVPIGNDGRFVVYASDHDGWEDLRAQINLALSGGSSIYTPDMSVLEFAKHWTPDPAGAPLTWATNVASKLGVSISTPISEV